MVECGDQKKESLGCPYEEYWRACGVNGWCNTEAMAYIQR